ncbi:DUF6492 family protein [Rhodococcus aetherivorans]|uniref:DUF6492 family protein n=1 Tax=Rhodococcus aetherivorans TaxID=191292 RepID=UPI0003E206D9|nr:DUF6492 family protein [Rhodococcus aetherivorans]ETT26991.1 hypothetical protein RR21198_2359 [Rhodococcus rhodochrous ATCC 21198]MDV6295455.1 DUF6492 family protein [Rhodococcus aetherivorans]
MGTLAVLTASYRPDFRHFTELHSSVVQYTSDDVVHHVVVPNRDVALFTTIESRRLTVHPIDALLPRSFLSTYPLGSRLRGIPRMSRVARVEALNLLRPWPPVRGWVLQQIVKLAATSRIEANVVLLVDSDVALIRPVGADDFLRGGAVRFYRLPGGITTAMARHAAWRDAANRLLGLDARSSDPSADYVTSFLTWDPRIVRRVGERVREVTGDDWRAAVARELHFSECFLYGTYVDRLGTDADRSFTRSDTLCRSHWGTTPLDRAAAVRFVDSIGPDDVAVHVQSTSRTPPDIRRYVLDAAAERVKDF